ncbi:hypothetical protein C0J50_15299 [Silurus asotus]|uniref:Uncharacterized protein n=1 Tax=Silurus asotus TaxID=30991 RepID=A0AAD5FR85_SILAS|nr:hypothetical protein C0J50_15299 [Silurus asotus]
MHWFIEDCLQLYKGLLYMSCDPRTGDFGFHRFYNRPMYDGSRLLYFSKCPFWIVGNLNYSGAEQLPTYVRRHYNRSNKSINKYRIIVCVIPDQTIRKVYATEHSDWSEFNPDCTFRIPIKLILQRKKQLYEIEKILIRGLQPYIDGLYKVNKNCQTRVQLPPPIHIGRDIKEDHQGKFKATSLFAGIVQSIGLHVCVRVLVMY